MTNPDDVKEIFYEDFKSTIAAVTMTGKLIILGDFNVGLGTDNAWWEGILGTNSIGSCNSYGLLLLETCTAHELLITNSIFHLPNDNKMSWIHPHSKHWYLLNYITVRQRDKDNVRIIKAMCSVNCWTDHRLIVSKPNIQIQHQRQWQDAKAPKWLNISRFKSDIVEQTLAVEMDSKLEPVSLGSNYVESDRTIFIDAIYAAATEVIDATTCKHHDWFDKSDVHIQALFEEKHYLYRALLNDLAFTPKKLCSATSEEMYGGIFTICRTHG